MDASKQGVALEGREVPRTVSVVTPSSVARAATSTRPPALARSTIQR